MSINILLTIDPNIYTAIKIIINTILPNTSYDTNEINNILYVTIKNNSSTKEHFNSNIKEVIVIFEKYDQVIIDKLLNYNIPKKKSNNKTIILIILILLLISFVVIKKNINNKH
jgi:hypothetical protein